jgi:glycosyltransferase involved in cell wall biosynthesis
MAKKKVLLLADDIRHHSGIATMSREIIRGTVHKYDWVQIAGSKQSPDRGKIIDVSKSIQDQTGVKDAKLFLYPTNGYGDEQFLKSVIEKEKPDVLLHFTDPRYWEWLYQIEREIRQRLPITYYNIWDDLPYPMWNQKYYRSCDSIFNITEQTHNLVRSVLGEDYSIDIDEDSDFDYDKSKVMLNYSPHGINPEDFFPIKDTDEKEYQNIKSQVYTEDFDFIIFYNNRNIRRKQTSDIILAYKAFCKNLPKEKADKTLLLMHTHVADPNGTDLNAVHKDICPECNVKIFHTPMSTQQMNILYNLVDVTVNIGSNEGHGLSNTESMMTGTPTITNVTGGLQSQCGFRDENGKLIKFSTEWGSNNDGKYRNHGKWVRPVYPSSRSIQGSPQTPYIFDDRAKWEDVAEGMMYWYLMPKKQRNECGEAGREFCLGEGGFNSENMCNKIIEGIETTLKHWKPREKFDVLKVEKRDYEKTKSPLGFEIPKIDVDKLKGEIKSD